MSGSVLQQLNLYSVPGAIHVPRSYRHICTFLPTVFAYAFSDCSREARIVEVGLVERRPKHGPSRGAINHKDFNEIFW